MYAYVFIYIYMYMFGRYFYSVHITICIVVILRSHYWLNFSMVLAHPPNVALVGDLDAVSFWLQAQLEFLCSRGIRGKNESNMNTLCL